VECACLLSVNAAGGAVRGKFLASIDLRDGGVSDRPDVLDAIDPGICISDRVPRVASNAHPKLVGLVGDRFQLVQREKLTHLDRIIAFLFLTPHDRACIFDPRHFHVTAPSPGALGVKFALSGSNGLASRPDPRTTYLAAINALLLRQAPRAILL